MKTNAIEQPVLEILSRAVVEGNTVRLHGQLERKLYERVNKVLEGLGGKWNKKQRGHLFESDPAESLESAMLTGSYEKRKLNLFDYFPTPPTLVDQVIRYADLRTGMSVLEPEAGEGAIAKAASEIVGLQRVTCCEIDHQKAERLRGSGFEVAVGDFLTAKGGAGHIDNVQCLAYYFDRVLMNPPFSRQQDIDHVRHAWQFVNPGGRLVALMASGVTFRQNSKTTEFRDSLINQYGWCEENPAGSFKESGTSVGSVTVVLDKPAI